MRFFHSLRTKLQKKSRSACINFIKFITFFLRRNHRGISMSQRGLYGAVKKQYRVYCKPI